MMRTKITVCLLLLIGFISTAVFAQTTPQHKAMPNLAGMTVEQASIALKSEGIPNYWISYQWTADRSKHHKVYAQYPEPGKPAIDPTIYYYIFDEVIVPNVVGLPYAEATDVLGKAGFNYKEAMAGVLTQDKKLSGIVAGQDPPAGSKMPRGDSTITLSRYKIDASPALIVPNVVGMDMDTADRVLGQAGFVHIIRGGKSAPDRIQNPTIKGQDPPAGSRAPKGSIVRLELWEQTQVPVPNVTDHSLTNAVAALKRAGLKMAVIEQPVELKNNDGFVKAQDRPAGAMVPPGTIITLTVYRFDPLRKDLVTVPLLIGITYSKAIGLLTRADLNWKKVDRQTRHQMRHDRVAAQDPRSGSKVSKGTTVQLEVYRYENKR